MRLLDDRSIDMKFINRTGNSVYIEDIDYNISFLGDEIQEIATSLIKRSSAFQKLVLMGGLEVVDINNERIEKNLLRLQKEANILAVTDQEEARMPSGETLEVVIKGHFYEAGGYAKVNRNLALGLSKLGTKVEIKPVSTRQNDLNEMEVRMLGEMRRSVGKHAIKIDSIIPSFSDISPRNSYRILYTTLESSTIPQQTIDICNQYDEIWVVSDFCKEVFEKHKVKPQIYVFPCTINLKIYNEEKKPHVFCPSLNSFVFGSVFGWSYRKGYDALLKAYLKEFSGNDDVSLLIVSRFQNTTSRSKVIQEEVEKFIKTYGGDNPPHIARCSRVIPEFEMPRIYRACNAFCLPTRGEAFGIPYAEASLCGVPVIATNYGGQTMFLNKDNSTLVDIDRLQLVQRGKMHVHYWDNQMFPALDSDAFINNLGTAMRNVFINYKEALEKNKKLQIELSKNYSVLGVCSRIQNRLNEIWANVRGEKK